MILRCSAAGLAAAGALLVSSTHHACPVEAFSSPSLRSAGTAPRRRSTYGVRTVSFDSDSSGNPNRNQHRQATNSISTSPCRLLSPTQLYSSVSGERDSKTAEQQQEDYTAVLKQTFESQESKILGQPIPYGELTVGVMRETYRGENRVSLSPDAVGLLTKAGLDVVVESGGAFLLALLVCVVNIVDTKDTQCWGVLFSEGHAYFEKDTQCWNVCFHL